MEESSKWIRRGTSGASVLVLMPLLLLLYLSFQTWLLLLFNTISTYITQDGKCFLPSASKFHPRLLSFSALFLSPVLTVFPFQYSHHQCPSSLVPTPVPRSSALLLLGLPPGCFLFLPSPSGPDPQNSSRRFKASAPSQNFPEFPCQTALSLPSELSRALKHLPFAMIISY